MEKIPCFLFQKKILFFKNGQKKCPKLKILKILLKKSLIDCIF